MTYWQTIQKKARSIFSTTIAHPKSYKTLLSVTNFIDLFSIQCVVTVFFFLVCLELVGL